jgi:cell shape-determining protein MreC
MIILREQETAQTLNAIIYGSDADTIVLRDEETNIETEIDSVFSIDKYYVSTSVIFPIKENKYYTLTIKDGTNIVYRDKIFCTNQALSTYSINKDEYIQHVTTNEYKIFE